MSTRTRRAPETPSHSARKVGCSSNETVLRWSTAAIQPAGQPSTPATVSKSECLMPEVYRHGAPGDQGTAERRPPSRGPADWVLDVVAVLGLVGAWVVVAVSWGSLPDHVPQHFGLTGRPDAWGGRGAILIGPSVATA